MRTFTPTTRDVRSFLDEIEAITDERPRKPAMATRCGKVYAEAKACGFDTDRMREAVKTRTPGQSAYERVVEMTYAAQAAAVQEAFA